MTQTYPPSLDGTIDSGDWISRTIPACILNITEDECTAVDATVRVEIDAHFNENTPTKLGSITALRTFLQSHRFHRRSGATFSGNIGDVEIQALSISTEPGFPPSHLFSPELLLTFSTKGTFRPGQTPFNRNPSNFPQKKFRDLTSESRGPVQILEMTQDIPWELGEMALSLRSALQTRVIPSVATPWCLDIPMGDGNHSVEMTMRTQDSNESCFLLPVPSVSKAESEPVKGLHFGMEWMSEGAGMFSSSDKAKDKDSLFDGRQQIVGRLSWLEKME